ncbi:MAG TPA: hypothetical protein VK966_10045, partial [Longimicrobiales bacterium]|nr:hypothetical protein [Longimicrobiales bacterium]
MAEYVLTVYEADGTTPLFEVGTASGHANPYLAHPQGLAGQEIDPLNGGASIAQVQVRAIDPRTGATQAERWLTSRLGIPTGQTGEGHSAINGRRAVLETAGGRVVLDGMAYGVRLNDSYAGFTATLKDTRERERRVPVFTSAAVRDASGTIVAAPTVIPRGRLEGYGQLPQHDQLPSATARRLAWTIPPAQPITGTYRELGGPGDPNTVPVISVGETDDEGVWSAEYVA